MPQFTHRSGEGGWGAARADLAPYGDTTVVSGGWRVERVRGAPADLHRLGLGTPVGRLVRWCASSSEALVLGSAQPAGDVDVPAASAAGIAVARRHSGGSAVLVGPGHLLWVDLVIGRRDVLWHDDVGQAPLWAGSAWAQALASVGVSGGTVHDGALQRGSWGHLVCFAGVGAGEVVVDGSKVVGISQRRTRDGALFQCAAMLRWDPARTVAGLAVPDRAAVALELGGVAAGVEELGPAGAGEALTAALLDHLP